VQRAVLGIIGTDVKNYIDQQKEAGKEVDLGTVSGIYVDKVVEDGAAEEAGIEAGDVITALDGKEVKNMATLQERITQKHPGDKVAISYLHSKKKVEKTVTLKNEQGNTKVVKKADLDILGANFRPITQQQKEQLDLNYGLEVMNVQKGRMQEAGINKGFIITKVNNASVKSVEDLQQAVTEASTSKQPVLFIEGIYPTGKKAYFAVALED